MFIFRLLFVCFLFLVHQGYVLTGGTLSNTNFVAISANSKNKLGAVVAANFLGSAQANYYRAFNLGSVEVYTNTRSYPQNEIKCK